MFTKLTEEQYLSFRDVHENGKAGHVIALAADVGVVSEDEVTAFGRPSARPSDTDKQKHIRVNNRTKIIQLTQ